MSEPIKGKRVNPDHHGNLYLKEGEYGKFQDVWYARPPGMSTGSLENHEVIEHGDGSITVKPSILIRNHESEWHGFLEKGAWREV